MDNIRIPGFGLELACNNPPMSFHCKLVPVLYREYSVSRAQSLARQVSPGRIFSLTESEQKISEIFKPAIHNVVNTGTNIAEIWLSLYFMHGLCDVRIVLC